MKRTNILLLAGLLTGGLIAPNLTISAFAKDDQHEGKENHGKHKGWEKKHGKKFDHSEHDRRDYRRGYWEDHRRRNYPRHDVRLSHRGHHNKAEIRQDFKDVRNARREVQEGRVELRKDYAELRKDRAELRRDIRNGASKAEIMKDRQEIRDDMIEIRKDRAELRRDQTALNAARQELKSDLRKR
jgi:hypothetical protein